MSCQKESRILPPWSYGVIPSHDADPRTLKVLTRGELACFVAIARCMNGRTFESYPSMETIGRVAGMNTRNARKHIAALVAKGWIERVSPSGGRAKTTVYRFVVPEPEETDTRSAERPGIETINPVCLEPKTRSVSNENPVGFGRKPGRTHDPRTQEQKEQKKQQQADAAGFLSEKEKADYLIRRKLLSAGISPGQTMNEILSGGLTLGEIDRIIAEWQNKPGSNSSAICNGGV